MAYRGLCVSIMRRFRLVKFIVIIMSVIIMCFIVSAILRVIITMPLKFFLL